MSFPAPVAARTKSTRKLLLHLKCLFWCLHQTQTRYDLNLVFHSLERHRIHPEMADSNLGDNLAFLLEHLEDPDLKALAAALRDLSESIAVMDIADKHFEIAHYLQSLEPFGPIPRGAYGIISRISPQLRGLFVTDGNHLIETPFPPASVRTIFGTYIV